MPAIVTYKIKGLFAVLTGGAVMSGLIAVGLSEALSAFIGIAVTAAIDVAFRFWNRTSGTPFRDPEAGGTFAGLPVWICCILMTIFIAAIYSGFLQ